MSSRARSVGRDRLSQVKAYFDSFNYSFANEDSRVEASLCRNYKSAVSICGAGGRAFALIPSGISTLKIIDISDIQILYARFQFELIKKMERDDFLRLMGFKKDSLENRRRLLAQLNLQSEISDFAEAIPDAGLSKGLIYSGRWENYLMTVSKWIRFLLRHDFRPYFEAGNLQEQQKLFQNRWPKNRLKFLMKLIANPHLMNKILYKGRMAGGQSEDLISFLKRNFETFFQTRPAREGFFHQLLFLGEVGFEEAYPPHLSLENYKKIQKFSGEIKFIKKDLISALQSEEGEFWSCSDVLSYFGEKDLEQLEQTLERRNSHQRLVFRSFLKHPFIDPPKLWQKRADLEADAASQDSTCLYNFQIFDSL